MDKPQQNAGEGLPPGFWMAWQTEGRRLEEEILAAAKHFQERYGRAPSRLRVARAVEAQVKALNGALSIEVEAVGFLQPHHLWLS